jgi:hypothetical protein
MMFRILVTLVLCTCVASAAEFTLKVADKAPPTEINESIRSLLQPKAVQLLDGDKPVVELWLAKELTLQSKPSSPATALDAVKQTTVLGAASFASPRRDYREDEIAKGIYTVRFAQQQQDGNHLGTAEFTYFAVLVPAKLDAGPDAIKDYKQLVNTSSKETSTDHPMVISLRPVSSAEGEFPKLATPAPEHKSVRVKIPGKGADTAPVVFDIIYEGKGHK